MHQDSKSVNFPCNAASYFFLLNYFLVIKKHRKGTRSEGLALIYHKIVWNFLGIIISHLIAVIFSIVTLEGTVEGL